MRTKNRILYNPASEIELPRAPSSVLPAAVLRAMEAERVLALPDLSDPLGLRDRAMMELLYATGIRRAELEERCRSSSLTWSAKRARAPGQGQRTA